MLLGNQGNKNLREINPGHEKGKRNHQQEENFLIDPEFSNMRQQIIKLESVILIFRYGLRVNIILDVFGDERRVRVPLLNQFQTLVDRIGIFPDVRYLLLGRHFTTFSSIKATNYHDTRARQHRSDTFRRSG